MTPTKLIPATSPLTQREARRLLKWCVSERDALLDCIRRAVEIESPSGVKQSIDEMARFFASQAEAAGGKSTLLDHPSAGAAVVAEFPAREGGPHLGKAARPILLLGHHDTVWALGTLRSMPFRVHSGRAFGPGVLDMKSGIVGALCALRALRALDIPQPRPVRLFLNPDEEVSSLAFRRRILNEGRGAAAVLVLEPAAGAGALKTARKGVGEFRITVRGRSAHAGINPAAGVNAVTELARQILRIDALANPARGVTLTAGVIEGGTRVNVVPEVARARIDVRAPRPADGLRIEQRIYALKPVHPEARIEIEGGINRPPMERVRAAALFKLARNLGREMGLELTEASTGGGSDGNFTAALGIPTLDGLGGVGDGAHARHEHVLIRELPRRAALLAALIASL